VAKTPGIRQYITLFRGRFAAAFTACGNQAAAWELNTRHRIN